jgi:hypothetical protein
MHTSHFSRRRLAPCTLILFACFITSASAQTGPALLVKPWPENEELLDSHTEAFISNSGHTTRLNDRFHLSDYESVGRFRIIPGNEISPRVGYDFTFLDLHTTNKRLPNQLSDDSIAVGSGLFKNGSWIGAMTVGLGYAGSSPIENCAGWYGKADAILVKQLNNDDFLGFVVDYDGHRSYAPDLPLPGVGYSHRFDPKLQMVVGFPYSSVSWKPIERLDFEFEYAMLSDIRARLSYEFIKHWMGYGLWDYRRDAFHVSNLEKDRRLLFVQHRIETGIRFQPVRQATFGLGIGYGFDGELNQGFDFQRTHRIADFSDEPYVRGEVDVRF